MRRPGAILLVALLLGCASPPLDVHEHPWWEVEGSLFVLRGNADRAEIERMAEELELFVEVVRAVADFELEPPRHGLRVYLLRDARTLLADWQAGLHSTRTRSGDLALVRRLASRADTRGVLYHEFVHFLLRYAVIYYPLWYQEGLAELLSTVREREGLVSVGHVPDWRRHVLFAEERSSVSELLAARGYDLPDFYSLSWLLVHYLHTGGLDAEGGLRARGIAFLERLARGEAWEPAFEASFQVKPALLEAGLERHRQRVRAGYVRLLHLGAEAFEPAPTPDATALSVSDAAADLAELLVLEGRATGARRLLRSALERDPDHARALATLAWSQARTGRPRAAERTLRRAVELDGTDPRVWLQAGRVVSLRGHDTAERAREHYRRAAELDPQLPAAWAELGLSHADSPGDSPGPGIEALERAMELRPADAELHLAMGKLRLRAGEPRRAREHLLRVDRWSWSEEWRDEARALLAELGEGEGSS